MLKDPCDRTTCKHWEKWTQQLPRIINHMSQGELCSTLMVCLFCHHFVKEDNYTTKEEGG